MTAAPAATPTGHRPAFWATEAEFREHLARVRRQEFKPRLEHAIEWILELEADRDAMASILGDLVRRIEALEAENAELRESHECRWGHP